MRPTVPDTSLIVESATAIAAALVMRRGYLSEAELLALPMVGSEEIANAVRHRLISHYGFRFQEEDTRTRRTRGEQIVAPASCRRSVP